jgi:hypothetical protein
MGQQTMKNFLLGAGAALLLAGSAQANITPVLSSVTASGSNFLYTYQVTLDTDQGLVPGSKTSIFDFAGYVPGSVTSSSAFFVAGSELVTSGLITNPLFTDDPTLTNLTLTSNTTFNASGGPFPETNFTLTALSTFNNRGPDGYVSGAVKNNGTAMGQTFNVGPVDVPMANVPEPATWGLMMLGFGGVGAMMRRRKTDMACAA